MPAIGPNVRVVGDSGSGKTTLAAAIAARLGLRHVELDALSWMPNWTSTPRDELRRRVAAELAEPGWVVDGNYLSSLGDLTFAAADTVVWLDLPPRVTLPRTLARCWRRWRTRELLWGVNRERLWEHFLPWDRSLLWWTLTSHRRRRRAYEAAMADPEQRARFVRLRSPAAVERWRAAALPPETPD